MPEPKLETANPNDVLFAFTEAFETGTFPRVPTPAFVYTFFRYSTDVLGVDDYDTYFSTVITSGGAALPDGEGNTLPFKEALQRNAVYALDLASAAITDNPELLSEASSVNPVALGKVPVYHFEDYGTVKVEDGSWGQDDFLRLWFAVILGLKSPDVDGQEDWLNTELYVEELFQVHSEISQEWSATMNDKNASLDNRKVAYQQFTLSFLECVDAMQAGASLESQPVDRMVRLIDANRTLGGKEEVRLGDQQHIPVFDVALTGGDWHEKGLGAMVDDLSDRGAEFAVPTGRLVLALAAANENLPPTDTLTDTDRHRLSHPALGSFQRFMSGIKVADGTPEREAGFYRATATQQEFGVRRKATYNPDVVANLLAHQAVGAMSP